MATGFMKFSGCLEREHWPQMGWKHCYPAGNYMFNVNIETLEQGVKYVVKA